jgi:hypothetical protein
MVHSEYEEFEKLVLILQKKGVITEEEVNLVFGNDSLEESNYL